MPLCRLCTLLLLLASPYAVCAQERLSSLALPGSLTTSPKLYPHPDSPDDLTLGQFLQLSAAAGIGADYRRYIPDLRLWLGVAAEYITNPSAVPLPHDNTRTIDVRDGYIVVPVELSAYLPIPVGGPDVLWTIGGGGGAYFGRRSSAFGSAASVTLGATPGYGIRVLSDVEYPLSPLLALRTEAKFRSIHFDSVDDFPDRTTVAGGVRASTPSGDLHSRVIADGMTVSLQSVCRF